MRRRRLVSGEEDQLWKRAVRDVAPLQGRAAPPDDNTSGEDKRGGDMSSRDMPPARASSGFLIRPSSSGVRLGQSVFDAGDPRRDRHARRGRIDIEATLDLHGLGQAAAHTALSAFLERAHRAHLSCVLVVTGKGAPSAPLFAHPDKSPRGVIRARFFEWMDAQHLRALTARVAPAAQKHGGAGAFYVFLKSGRALKR